MLRWGGRCFGAQSPRDQGPIGRLSRAGGMGPHGCEGEGLAGMVSIKVKRLAGAEDLPLPQYQTEGASGLDLRAAVPEPVCVEPGRIALIPTGFCLSIPPGFEGQVRPRSGLALKHGVCLLNSPGTIDSDYRGEVQVILANLGGRTFEVKRGDRIAQLVVARVVKARLEAVAELDETQRGAGGFGHTGV